MQSQTTTTVRTEDGVDLHVEVDDAPAPLTVVFVHGFTARLEEFALQRETLRGRARAVVYDCRGHGRTRRKGVRSATIDQLGRDLGRVVDATVPAGPVVLLGHSMGGMTIMALARQRPELFGPRVVGAFLLATSSGGLVEAGVVGLWTRVVRKLGLLPLLLFWMAFWAPLAERVRRRGSKAGRAWFRHYLFGTDDADPATVEQVQALLEQTPFPVVAAFYRTLLDHDEHASLQAMRDIPVTLLVGDSDRLTPASHSERMAEALPDAELIIVPGAGHSVNITRRQVVDDALLRLLDRAQAASAA
ncbi:MAG: Pimeloyl-ACP methyl ester carboxylesterase [Frankiales bacterium]|nr:Pimeloyl-ACP methyl ester carboxylesterase [Frankiales bacterium]